MDTALHDLVDRVRAAHDHATPLCITGGGSKDFVGLVRRGEPLPTSGLQGIVSYEPSELVVTVRAGTPLPELEAALAVCGQYLPFEPPHLGQHAAPPRTATVGGMVASGLSGPARASVGAVRDYVLGLELVNGRGELLRFGGQVMKNVAGYDVSRLMAGSWGTLGVLTELSLKVLPVAPAQATLRWDDIDQATALHKLHAWGALPLPLNASCWVAEHGVGRLYVRLRGAAAAVQAACASMGGAVVEHPQVADDWLACRDQRLPWFTERADDHCLWRLSVPQTAPVLALPAGMPEPLVEWHGALRWVQAPRAAGPALQAAARAVGGSAMLFRAEGLSAICAGAIFDPQNAAVARIHQQLKHAFDPAGILNPGRTAVGG